MIVRKRYFDPNARKRGEMLRKYREQYKFRVVRNHQTEPDPRDIAVEIYGHFAKVPASSGDEWFFTTRAARDKFITKYGGEPIDG